MDEIIPVKNDDAFETSRKVAKSDGLLVGISSGAALYAATQLAKRKENAGKILLFYCRIPVRDICPLLCL